MDIDAAIESSDCIEGIAPDVEDGVNITSRSRAPVLSPLAANVLALIIESAASVIANFVNIFAFLPNPPNADTVGGTGADFT